MAYLKTKEMPKGVLVIAYSDLHEVLFTASSNRDGYSVVVKQSATVVNNVKDEEALLLLANQIEKEGKKP